jgi:signal peptidase I
MTTYTIRVGSRHRAGWWTSPLADWVGLGAATAVRIYLVVVATLALAATAPMAFGWQTSVVRSGSMRSCIEPGDLIVAAPVTSDQPIGLGRVMTFTDPADPSKHLVHRVVAIRDDGMYTTAGDANPGDDSSPVARSAIDGLARLRIPWIGLPAVWWARGDSGLLGGWLGLTVTAGALGGHRRSKPAHRSYRTTQRRRRAFHQLCASPIAMAALMLTTAQAAATTDFAQLTVTAGNSWAVATRLLQPYNAAVLSDSPYFFYLTDESGGLVAADVSGNNVPGTYNQSFSSLQPNGLPRNPGFAVQLGGNQASLVSGGDAVSDPTTFSLEMWFKTATITGGKLMGFENSQDSFSNRSDRHVLMLPNGRLSYGEWKGKASVLTTPMAYNDNAWHHLIVTTRPSDGKAKEGQSAVYVDDVSVVSGPTTPTASYSGWWRVGFGSLTTGKPGYPDTVDFAGSIDNVAVYNTELSAARVAAHYAAR